MQTVASKALRTRKLLAGIEDGGTHLILALVERLMAQNAEPTPGTIAA